MNKYPEDFLKESYVYKFCIPSSIKKIIDTILNNRIYLLTLLRYKDNEIKMLQDKVEHLKRAIQNRNEIIANLQEAINKYYNQGI